jgi:uncharacterized protein
MKKYLLLFILTTYYGFGQFQWTEIEIPVRDGKDLKADLWTSDTTEAKPCIFIQTPYNKELYRGYPCYGPGFKTFFDTSSYNYVIMDWRGFYANKDADDRQKDRGEDGYDGVEWIAEQSWCNGKVGTSGSSALGMIQFLTARQHPPHLVCCAPFVKDYKTKYTDYFYGGVLRSEHIEQLEKLGFITVETITNNPIYNNVWKMIENQSDYSSEIAVPMLMASGWFDHYPSDVIRAFEDIRKNSDESVRYQHKLIMGPWTHSGLGDTVQGELEFPEAAGMIQDLTKHFFAYYLLGAEINWLGMPNIRYFQMGENIWKNADDWNSISQVSYDTLYLYGKYFLNDRNPPRGKYQILPRDTIIYDPHDPSPTVGGSRFNPFESNTPVGPYDISDSVENRDDILIYSTEELEEQLSITGKINIELFVQSDRKDTDFSVRLCDVYPDGRSMILTQGIKRARFRENLETEVFMDSLSVYPITIELNDIAYTYLEGHKFRIDITCSNFPMFDKNPNTGGEMYVPGDTLTAINSVHHSYVYPSKVIMPIATPLKIIENTITKNEIFVYPNPFNESTNISFNLGVNSNVKISLFNSLGQEIEVVVDKFINAGNHQVIVDIPELPQGLYFYMLQAGDQIQSGTLIKLN